MAWALTVASYLVQTAVSVRSLLQEVDVCQPQSLNVTALLLNFFYVKKPRRKIKELLCHIFIFGVSKRMLVYLFTKYCTALIHFIRSFIHSETHQIIKRSLCYTLMKISLS